MEAVQYGTSPIGIAFQVKGKPATFGGKDVHTFAGLGQFVETIYVVGDTVFVIRPTTVVAEEVLVGLP